jgi:putative phage-type endonuclease
MQVHNLVQGSPAWLAYRSMHFNASDAPAMMNCSPYKTRTQLLNEIKTGLTPEVDAHTQRIFNDGHRFEELARPLAEKILGEDLFPVTGSIGELSASFDGLTMDEAIAWEHKTINDKLRSVNSAEELPLNYRVQMEQQLLVSGAMKCLFMATKWDNDELVDEKHFEYTSDQKLRDDIICGWEQFNTDLADHEVKTVVELPKAESIMDLPAVIVQVKGELTLCNMADVRPQFDSFLANAITVMETDEDFALAEAESKMGREVAKRCLATAKGVVDQTSSISEVTRELELYAAKFNALALSQEKAVKTQKEARKIAIMNEAVTAFIGYKALVEADIHPIKLISAAPDFAGAMKNKRTIASLEDAVASELANAKIEIDAIARAVRINLLLLLKSDDYRFLFNDIQTIIYQTADHFKLTVENRIDSHKRAEAEKLEAQRLQIEVEAKRKAEADQAKLLEAERQKIRQEEQAKLVEELRLEALRVKEELAKAEANKPTPEKLRARAKEIATGAEYADSNATRNAELAGASKLRAEADELEKAQEVTPTLKDRIIWAVVGEFNVSFKEAEDLIMKEFFLLTEKAA